MMQIKAQNYTDNNPLMFSYPDTNLIQKTKFT